jgi:hypothetical protein
MHRKMSSNPLYLLFILILTLTACQSTYTKKFNQSEDNYGTRTGQEKHIQDADRVYGLQVAGGDNHNNKKLTYSKAMSAIISDMSGVYVAIVMETDRNAYVAVMYDDSATGIKSSRSNNKEVDNTGETRGMYDTYTGSQYADPNKIATGINSYYTSKEPADLSTLFQQRVALALRKENPRLLEVHISANRDFVNQMNVYWNEARQGVNLNGYLEEFNKLVRAMFGVTR